MIRISTVLLIAIAMSVVGCRPTANSTATSSMDCTTSLQKFDHRDFAEWKGLSASCTPAVIAEYAHSDLSNLGQFRLGKERRLASFKMLAFGGYAAPAKLWFRGDTTCCIEVESPALEGVDEVLSKLGEPVAKLDYYFDVMHNRGGEYVYADRGLTLFMSSNRSNVVKLWVYVPMSLDDYIRDLHHEEPPREEQLRER